MDVCYIDTAKLDTVKSALNEYISCVYLNNRTDWKWQATNQVFKEHLASIKFNFKQPVTFKVGFTEYENTGLVSRSTDVAVFSFNGLNATSAWCINIVIAHK